MPTVSSIIAGLSLALAAGSTAYSVNKDQKAHEATDTAKGKLAADAQAQKDELAKRQATEAADAENARARESALMRTRAARAGMGRMGSGVLGGSDAGSASPATAGKTLLGA